MPRRKKIKEEPPYYPLIKDIGKYLVYGDGRVWSKRLRKPIAIKQHKTSGYVYVNIIGNKSKLIRLNRLVAQCFLPNPENLPQVHHKDNNKLNNDVNNLKWCTASFNAKQSHLDGLHPSKKGTKNHNAKLTEEEARVIKYDYPYLTHAKLARKLGNVSEKTIGNIRRGSQWTHI